MEKVEVSPSMHVGRKSQCVDASPGFLSSSCGSGASHAIYPDIENLSRCELLWWFGEMSADLPIAYGLVYPSSDRYLDDDLRMHEHCVKVQVDHVLPAFMGIPVPDETCIEGKMLLMNQTLRKFIQWPRKAIKMQLSSDVPIQSGINDFLTDDILLPDGFLDTMNASECPQNQDVEQQMVMKPVVQKSQTEQPKPKKAMATKNKSKGKRKQVQAKLTYQERQAEKVKLHLQLIELRPEWHKKMVGRLGGYIGNDWATTLPYSAAPENMFPSKSGTYIEVESMLALFVKDWVDLTIVFWFTWYFYKESKDKKGNRCAFLNVNTITGDMCKRNPREVEDHILSLATHHIDKDFILAPHLADDHWSLFIIAQHTRHVYILDSTKIKGEKNASNYRLSSLIATALGSEFNYTMVDCKQQKGGWECGYMVLQHMFDFVNLYQNQFPDEMWHDTREATDNEIDVLLMTLMPKFFRELGISLD
ncbi:putative Ulp1 protease family catalytic domain, papain-like cysteine peptidase superfamily [Helianthus annuus]|nr:putative Ulp1 protease family catalytic domain, papain-like cysteine peptidase superfamily [Helianthus annuus]